MVTSASSSCWLALSSRPPQNTRVPTAAAISGSNSCIRQVTSNDPVAQVCKSPDRGGERPEVLPPEPGYRCRYKGHFRGSYDSFPGCSHAEARFSRLGRPLVSPLA
jgi:hypothetical protein